MSLAAWQPDDHAHMGAALALGRRGLGRVAPNPAVGCVLVRGARVVGRGWTQPGGRPHAETEALRRAGPAAVGATAYVTLEPCAHHGRTPPCADALVAAGISRAVVAIGDPDPRVAGRGIERLKGAGIEVGLGLRADEAEELTLGFLTRVRQGRPLVTLKLATTLDGRIALASGESRWITGPLARAFGHGLRADHDAIMVGAGTVRADDPALTCRLPGLEDRSPRRIVVGGDAGLWRGSVLAATAAADPVWWAVLAGDPPACPAGVEPLVTPAAGGRIDLPALLLELGRRGLTRLLVEGGATLAAALLRASLVDRLVWFRSRGLIGGDGLSAVAALGLQRLADMPALRLLDRREAGDDSVETYALERAPCHADAHSATRPN